MIELVRVLGPWALFLIGTGWMLKLLVTDKLKSLQDTLNKLVESIESHDERIRALEQNHAELVGGLRAKGCLIGNLHCAGGDR